MFARSCKNASQKVEGNDLMYLWISFIAFQNVLILQSCVGKDREGLLEIATEASELGTVEGSNAANSVATCYAIELPTDACSERPAIIFYVLARDNRAEEQYMCVGRTGRF